LRRAGEQPAFAVAAIILLVLAMNAAEDGAPSVTSKPVLGTMKAME